MAQKCIELEAFKDAVLLELFRKQEILSYNALRKMGTSKDSRPFGGNDDDSDLMHEWEARGRSEYLLRDRYDITQTIRDMVDFQVEILSSKQSLLKAEAYIQEKPELLVNKIITHLQYVFEIKAMEGILPRMNQIYLFMEEMKNFLSSARLLLARDKSHPNSLLLADIIGILSTKGISKSR